MRLISFVTLAAAWGQKSASATAPASSHGTEEASLTFTALTNPLPLLPGEVTNTWHRLAVPSGPIAISEFAADVVEKDATTGEIVPVPLAEAYLHHHVVFSNHEFYDDQSSIHFPMKPKHSNRGVGFGAGTESRGTPQRFPYPYRFTTVEGEDELLANVHVINTRTMARHEVRRCLECPCTAEDRVEKDGLATTALLDSVIERKSDWDGCNSALVDEGNPSCSSDTYVGGLYCCEHGEFCLDDYFLSQEAIAEAGNGTRSVFYLRYTLTYAPVAPEVKPLYLAACCDASGDETLPGNIEYDIPKCGEDDGDCVHELETVQALHGAAEGAFGTGGAEDQEEDVYVDVVYMVGHLHRGGISMSSYFMNGTALCESLPTYGTGHRGEIGNEPGYINSMSACTFDPPLRMKTTEKIRVVGRYNATKAHTGVMSLFYIAVADVDELAGAGASWTYIHSLAAFVGMGAVIGAAYLVANKYLARRQNYESIPNEEDSREHSVLQW